MARASLELKLDYEDFLRQRQLSLWSADDFRREEFLKVRFRTTDEFALRVQKHKQFGTIPEVAANGALLLLSVTCRLLDRQIQAQAISFQKEGGFTERLYRTRIQERNSVQS